jgi:UDP-glucose 4-epimerase
VTKAVRPNPPATARPRVLITQGASPLGRALARRLHRNHDVLSFDAQPFDDRPKDVEHHQVDVRRKAAIQLAKKRPPKVVIAVGNIHVESTDGRRTRSQTVVEVAAQVLQLVEAVQADKLIYLSSALLYGPSATSAAFLNENAPLLGARAVRRYADAISVDMMVQSFFWKQPNTETVVLRPMHVVGPAMTGVAMRYLSSPTVPTMMGFDPMLQLLHIDDLLDAVVAAAAPGVRGVFNIVGATQAPLSRVLTHLKRTTIPVPEAMFHFALRRLAGLRLANVNAEDLVHLKYSCLVDGSLAQQQLGYTAKRSLQQTLDAI